MSTPKTTLFKRGDKIRLLMVKRCLMSIGDYRITILLNYVLRCTGFNSDYFYFEVSFNRLSCDNTTAESGDGIRISRLSFEALSFDRIKNPTP